SPTLAGFGWALVIGLAAALFGTVIRRSSLRLATLTQPRIVTVGPLAGLGVAGLAVWYSAATGHSASDVLFSGQSSLPGLLPGASRYGVWTLIGLLAAKGAGYAICLACFRGGPVFPALFLGAAGGIAFSHLPGLPMLAGAAMGTGAMAAAMLRLPLT